MMDVKRIIRDALILFAITLIAGLALGATHEVTTPIIVGVRAEKAEKTYKEVFPTADHFGAPEEMQDKVDVCDSMIRIAQGENVTVDQCMKAYVAKGEVIGYLVTASSKEGYGGEVTISVGIDKAAGKLTGVGFLTLNETAGLGMKAKEPEFKDQFTTKSAATLTVIKTDGAGPMEVEAISGATKTSRAVTNAVNAAVYFVMECLV
ncbi:MAG: FMN-binding protein [Eubacteriales bacterium]|nr:FMN-binding protein [Eubacteriales bacterium]